MYTKQFIKAIHSFITQWILLITIGLILTISLTACNQTATQTTIKPTDIQDLAQTIEPTSQPGNELPTAEPTSTTEVSQPVNEVSFVKDILPIFKASCVRCHGGSKTEENLDLTSYAALMAGSDNGAVIVPGNPEESNLIELIVNGKMPKRGNKLSVEEIRLITDWVITGVKDN